MAQVRTNERDGTRALLRYSRTSAFKVRPVLDLIRGKEVEQAREILRFCDRDPAGLVEKVLASAVANAENNDGLDPEELYVSSCYADEANTMRRWRPRARGRATRIRKRSCHVTIIVSRLPEERLARMRARQARAAASRSRRVAGARQGSRQHRREAMEDPTILAQPGEGPSQQDEPDHWQGPEGEQGRGEEPQAAGEATAEDSSSQESEGGEPAPSTDEGGGER